MTLLNLEERAKFLSVCYRCAVFCAYCYIHSLEIFTSIYTHFVAIHSLETLTSIIPTLQVHFFSQV